MGFKNIQDRINYDKQYYIKNKKKLLIDRWKKTGLIGDYDLIYDRYLKSTECELCGITYDLKNKKNMEHNHHTGELRSICCQTCNMRMPDRKTPTNNITGYKNIIIKTDNRSKKQLIRYMYKKSIDGKIKERTFKTITEALCYKFIMILKHN